MDDRHQLDDCLGLMYALVQYRHQPIYFRLREMGRGESMLHPEVQLDELVNAGQLKPLGHYGRSTWVRQWRRLTPPPDR